MKRLEKKRAFIKRLAQYFANQAQHSIGLELKKKESEEWAELRSHTPLFGYQSMAEIEVELTEFLG